MEVVDILGIPQALDSMLLMTYLLKRSDFHIYVPSQQIIMKPWVVAWMMNYSTKALAVVSIDCSQKR